jgi:hypothetical protein
MMNLNSIRVGMVFGWMLIVAAILNAPQRSYSQTSENEIDRFIARQAVRENGEEYKEARKVVSGDLNRDGKPDRVVLYTLEGFNGTNNYLRYLAVFLFDGKSFKHASHLVVGGKYFRGVELRSVSGSTINLETMEYRKSDPACCPSRRSRMRYIFRGNRLSKAA